MENQKKIITLYITLFLVECLLYVTNQDLINTFSGLIIVFVQFYMLIYFVNLIMFFIINFLRKKRKFDLIQYISSFIYLICQSSILMFQIIILFEFQSKCSRECPYLCNIQFILLILCQIITTYIYMQQNRKIQSIVNQYGLLKLILNLFQIIFIFLLTIVTIYSYLRFELFQYEQGFITILLLLYLIVINMQNFFKSFGFENKQNVLLTNIIFFFLVQYVWFTFSYLNDFFDLIQLFIIILLIDSQSYQLPIGDDLSQIFQQDVFCFACRDYITKNYEVIYFQDSLNIFHKQCFVRQQQAYNQEDGYRLSMNFSQNNNNINDLLIYISILFANIFFYLIVILNDQRLLQDYFYISTQLIQFCLTIIIILLEFIKNSKALFLARFKFYFTFILTLLGFVNYYPLSQVIIEVGCVDEEGLDRIESTNIIFTVVLYYIYLIGVQAFLLSRIFLFSNRYWISQSHLIIFNFIILQSIFSILFSIAFYAYNSLLLRLFITVIILTNLFNTFESFYILQIKQDSSLEIITNKIKAVIRFNDIYLQFQKIPVILVLLKLIESYYSYSYYLYSFQCMQLKLKFFFLQQIFSQYYTLFIKWFCFKATEIINRKHQERIQNQDELIRPNIIDIQKNKCKYCKKMIVKGQNVIYKTKCKHSLHKSCINSWLNYPWCCQIKDNQDIEIIWN